VRFSFVDIILQKLLLETDSITSSAMYVLDVITARILRIYKFQPPLSRRKYTQLTYNEA
jgi:hypothetical protein